MGGGASGRSTCTARVSLDRDRSSFGAKCVSILELAPLSQVRDCHMTSASRRRANAMIRIALVAAPPERRHWVEAMRAEVAHLPDQVAPSFAFGCLLTMVRARAVSAPFIVQTARAALVLSAMGWSALNLRLAGQLFDAHHGLPAAFAYAAATIFALGALATAWHGLRATVVLATPLLVLMGFFAAGANVLLPPSPYNTLYQALALEDFTVLLIALLVARGIPGWAATQKPSNP